jgi:hypothetical protein
MTRYDTKKIKKNKKYGTARHEARHTLTQHNMIRYEFGTLYAPLRVSEWEKGRRVVSGEKNPVVPQFNETEEKKNISLPLYHYSFILFNDVILI